MEYLDWNKAIFEYFFNETSKQTDVLFSVDKYIIKDIGDKFGLDNPVLNFCNAIYKETVLINNRGKSVFQLNNIDTNIKNGIPFQTAIIAFLVLAASKMGEDIPKDVPNNEKLETIVERNYYTQLKKLLNCNDNIRNIEFTSFGNVFKNNYEEYVHIFSSFAKHIKQNYDCKVEFRALFERKNRKRKDWIGIPIFQSMISSKDYAILTQYFEKYQSTAINSIKIFDLSKFSRVFNIVANDYPQLLLNRIITLFKNWDGNIIEYDEKDKRIIRVANRNISPNLLYEQDYGKYNFYETLPKIKNMDSNEVIKTDEREYVWNNTLECYCSKSFPIDNGYFKTCSVKTSNNKLNIIYNLASKRWILFKYENGIYKAIDNALIGDTISLLCKTIHKNKYMQLIKVCASTSDIGIQDIYDNYSIIGPVNVVKENYILGIKDIENISLTKGLKNGYKSEYLRGAEPILKLTKTLKGSETIYRIDEDIINFIDIQNIVDLRKQYNSLGEHQIQLNNGERKHYKIVDRCDKNNAENVCEVYLNFSNGKLEKTTVFSQNIKNLVNGCFIENCDLCIANDIDIKHKNKSIVNDILKAIYKKNNVKRYKQLVVKNKFDLTDNISLRYLKEMEA